MDSPPSPKKPRITAAKAEALVDKYEQTSLLLELMQALKSRGWPRSFLALLSETGCAVMIKAGPVGAKDPLGPVLRKHIRKEIR